MIVRDNLAGLYMGGTIMYPMYGGTADFFTPFGEEVLVVDDPTGSPASKRVTLAEINNFTAEEKEDSRVKCLYCGNWGEEKTNCGCGAPLDPVEEEEPEEETREMKRRRLGLG